MGWYELVGSSYSKLSRMLVTGIGVSTVWKRIDSDRWRFGSLKGWGPRVRDSFLRNILLLPMPISIRDRRRWSRFATTCTGTTATALSSLRNVWLHPAWSSYSFYHMSVTWTTSHDTAHHVFFWITCICIAALLLLLLCYRVLLDNTFKELRT